MRSWKRRAKVTVADVLRSRLRQHWQRDQRNQHIVVAHPARQASDCAACRKRTRSCCSTDDGSPITASPRNGLSDTFVNLNALPMVAVERIDRSEKDGASAVYGSDAVAGVVNIITRDNFQGFEGGGSLSTTDKGGLGYAGVRASSGASADKQQ